MNITEVKDCWRCYKLQRLENYALRYNILRNQRLNICNECVEEEAKILGESVNEIIGVYTHMQKNFKNLDKSMYKRFWLKAVS